MQNDILILTTHPAYPDSPRIKNVTTPTDACLLALYNAIYMLISVQGAYIAFLHDAVYGYDHEHLPLEFSY